MMLVPTYVAPSRIEGVGIFSEVPIPAGSVIWRFDPMFDRLITEGQVEDLSEALRTFVDRYGYPHMTQPGLIVLVGDNGRFMNHSPQPNTVFTDPDFGYAKVDIEAGCELVCDYAEFDPAFQMLPGRQFVLADSLSRAAEAAAGA